MSTNKQYSSEHNTKDAMEIIVKFPCGHVDIYKTKNLKIAKSWEYPHVPIEMGEDISCQYSLKAKENDAFNRIDKKIL